jgi:hypothetical protein
MSGDHYFFHGAPSDVFVLVLARNAKSSLMHLASPRLVVFRIDVEQGRESALAVFYFVEFDVDYQSDPMQSFVFLSHYIQHKPAGWYAIEIF